jgi:addiction module RelB/DinJ family antitoxin
MQTILNIKTDKKLKEDAKKVAGNIGVPLSTVVNSFLKQFVRDEEVTFSAKSYKIMPYLESLVEEARRERAGKKKSEYFRTAKSFMKSLNS